MPKPPPPPRPAPRLREAEVERAPIAPPPLDVPVELDAPTQRLLSDAIAKAIAEQLGSVRISSVPPPKPKSSTPPPSGIRASMRAAADVGSKVVGKGGKVAIFGSGVLSLAASTIVWVAKPEYAAPLAQALTLLAKVILAAFGGGAPIPE